MLKNICFTVATLFVCHEIGATPPPYLAATSNQQLVANQLQTITNPTPSETILLDGIAPLSVEATQKVLSQMSGEQYTTLFTSTEISNRQFFRRLYDPLRPLISDPCSYEDEVYDLCSADGIDAWAEGSGNRSFLDGNKNASGFKMSGYEVSIGAQKRLSPTWTFGIGGCYAINHFNYNNGGSGKTNSVLGAVYTLYRPAHYYVLADVTFGAATNDMHRKTKIGDISYLQHSRPNINQVSFYTEAGFDWDCNCVLIQPFIGFEADRFTRNCKYDHGNLEALNLIYSGKRITNAYSRLGVHFTTPENCYDLTFYFDLAWQYLLTNPDTDLKVRFRDFGSSFTITGVPVERNSMSFAFAVSSEILEGWTLYLEASGERWKRVSNYNFTGGLLFKW